MLGASVGLEGNDVACSCIHKLGQKCRLPLFSA